VEVVRGSDGMGLASVFTGFVIQFPEPGSHQLSTIFLQILFSASQTRSHDFRLCSTAEGRRTIIFSGKQAGDPKLPLKTDTGQLQHIQYSVADSLKELVSAPFPCVAKDGTRSQWSVPAFANSPARNKLFQPIPLIVTKRVKIPFHQGDPQKSDSNQTSCRAGIPTANNSSPRPRAGPSNISCNNRLTGRLKERSSPCGRRRAVSNNLCARAKRLLRLIGF